MPLDRSIRIFMIVTMLLASNSGIRAQNQLECHLKADFVSSYIWRGQNLGHVSLQPELAVAWKGLSLAAWGSVSLSHNNDVREIDLTLSYNTGNLSFGIVDYWDDGNDNRYFFYKNGTGHAFEGFISYNLPLGRPTLLATTIRKTMVSTNRPTASVPTALISGCRHPFVWPLAIGKLRSASCPGNLALTRSAASASPTCRCGPRKPSILPNLSICPCSDRSLLIPLASISTLCLDSHFK